MGRGRSSSVPEMEVIEIPLTLDEKRAHIELDVQIIFKIHE
jgi:hypothetical protein